MNLNPWMMVPVFALMTAFGVGIGAIACSDSSTNGTPTDGGLSDSQAALDSSAESSAPLSFEAALSGDQEVPVVATSATGTTTLTLSSDETILSYHVTHNVSAGTVAHLHLAFPGEAGSVIYPLTPFSTDMTGTIAVTATDVTNLRKGKFYVNVHSGGDAGYPDGEVRGQVLPTGSKLYVAKLTGGQEVPPVATTATGHASVILDGAGTSFRYHVATAGLTATAAHLHNAIGSLSNPTPQFPFAPVADAMDGLITVTAADAADLADGHFYVNVHTAGNPNGELRGQLIRVGEILYTAGLSPDNEVPPAVGSTTSGGSQLILDPHTIALRYEVVVSNMTDDAGAPIDPTTSHIHDSTNAGAILYPLALTGTTAKGTLSLNPGAGDITKLDSSQLYVNVDSQHFPDGEIRGTIVKQ